MKHDLTTGTWQDDTGCPIIIILVTTSDAPPLLPPTMSLCNRNGNGLSGVDIVDCESIDRGWFVIRLSRCDPKKKHMGQ